ncbi:MAG: TlpA family protein disulfide reductase [Deltaproteobacteria bacterium]|nr:TlpA family protein disulfide reductase [Deltaproteobacteria bacterium]MBI4796290.1 TlpA family protein disulfide reductase [Deltaproteobacteria bacterium]
MNRKSRWFVWSCCLALLLFVAAVSLAADVEPKVGQSVGNVKFPKPASDEEAKYLGLDKAAEFTLKDIKAPYVLVEQFSTTCPHCLHQAPIMNQLYNLVEQDAALKGKIKFMGLGQGNDANAVKMWKAFQKIPFPQIADSKSTFGDALNFHPYPVSVLLDKSGKILWVHIGTFESADEALKGIKAVAK